jgi:hypothetical protein
MMDARYEGLVIFPDKDYVNYEARIERALKGYPEEASNAITPIGSRVEGIQVAGMEVITAMLFGWTHLDAPQVAVIATALFATLLFLLFFWLFREIGFPYGWSLGITLAFFTVMFYGLTRVVQPGWSFVFAILSLISVILFWKKQTLLRFCCAAVLLAFLPYLYFWHWTYVWAGVASLTALSLFSPQWNLFKRRPAAVIALAAVALLLSVPFFIDTVQLFRNSIYPEVAIRASFLYQRTPESWIRSVLLVADLVLFLSLFKRYRNDFSYLVCASLLLGLAIAMHQNIIHDRVLMFASHYEPYLIITTVVCGAWVLWKRAPLLRRLLIALLGLTFLLAGAYDYAFAQLFIIPNDQTYRDQHLAGAISQLKSAGQQTVLTDMDTGRIVTAWTIDGIVYTTHARFLLISDADLAERYCVSEMFDPSPLPARVLSIEYNRVLQSPEYQSYEQGLLTSACARVKKDPLAYLKKYGVTRILWNQVNRPQWQIDAKALHLTPDGSGESWKMWKVPVLQ